GKWRAPPPAFRRWPSAGTPPHTPARDCGWKALTKEDSVPAIQRPSGGLQSYQRGGALRERQLTLFGGCMPAADYAQTEGSGLRQAGFVPCGRLRWLPLAYRLEMSR